MHNIPIPRNHDQIIKAMRLYRSARIGPKNYFKLMSNQRDFDDSLERLQELARKHHVHDYKPAQRQAIEQEYQKGQEFGARLVFYGEKDYPRSLQDVEDAPPFLWIKGAEKFLRRPYSLAVIGSRNPTIEGVQIARNLAREVSEMGIPVVSGLARGIDTAAHEASLSAGTIAAVAGGLDYPYPKSNTRLQANIGELGVLVSEMPFGFAPQANNFPQRNRIIAGLSSAVLVIEAGLRSGTKITVNDALSIGREVMAVPGHPYNGLSALPNQLIQEGAKLIRNLDDILEILRPISTQPHQKATNCTEPLPSNRSEKERIAPPFIRRMEAMPTQISRKTNESDGNETPNETAAKLAELGKAILEGKATQSIDGNIHKLRE